MRLVHIGLNISDKNELENFYGNILGFHRQYSFLIEQPLSVQIFGIGKQTEVSIYSRENIALELFLCSKRNELSYSHVCLDVENIDIIIKKCVQAGYKVITRQRGEKTYMVFIQDKTGNTFELKQQDNNPQKES